MSQDKNDDNGPPPVPPRQTQPYNRVGFGPSPMYGFGSPYAMNPYQNPYNTYGLTGGFSGLAPGGLGHGGAGVMPQEFNFIRAAEESSMKAFESIESIVHAFSSLSMLMESTYFAVHSSFRAVLGVAEHMARLRQLMASLTILKSIKRFLNHILQIFRLVDKNDLAWSESLDSSTTVHQSLRGLWPIFIFLSLVVGTPWLLYKLISSNDCPRWAQQQGDHYLAVAKFPFETNQPNELSLCRNEKIIIAPSSAQPKIQGWLLASKMDGETIGLVPANYIDIEMMKK